MDSEHLTSRSDPRWHLLSTVTSLATILSFVAYVGLAIMGIASLGALGQAWFTLYFITVLASVTYVYGRETLEVVYSYKNGGFTSDDEE